MDINEIDKVAIIGAGIMGIGIAQSFAQAGIAVNLIDVNQSVLDSAMTQIQSNLELFQEYGLLKEETLAILSRINTLKIESLTQGVEGCNYVVEAIPEILEAKKGLLTMLEQCSPTAIIASNTSSFTVTELAEGMKYPEHIVGVHYFNPAHIIPVVEIHWGKETSEETVGIARELILKSGKKPAMVKKELPGFIINRLTAALEREIDYLLDEGVVTPEDLDTAVKGSIGFRMACLGPQEAEDMIGLDTSMVVSRRMFTQLSNSSVPSPQLVAKVKAGELGIKSGKGWYDYGTRSRTKVLDENNRKLLKQLSVFYSK